MSENLHKGHRKRLKELYKKSGFDTMEHHQILELLLFYAIPKKDTNETAHMLLNKFGSFYNVLDADIDELITVKGIGKHTASLIKDLKSMIVFYENFQQPGNYMSTFNSWYDYLLPKLSPLEREALFLIGVDGQLLITGFKEIPLDILNDDSVLYGEIIKILQLWKSYRFVLAHNKPFSHPNTSIKEQNYITLLKNKFSSIEIELIDFFIMGKGNKMVSAIYFLNLF